MHNVADERAAVIAKLKQAIAFVQEAAQGLAHLSEEDIQHLIGADYLPRLLFSFLAPPDRVAHDNPFQYMLKYKRHLQFAPILYSQLLHRCAFPVQARGYAFIVSPVHIQWVPNGVMYLEGDAPFSGALRAYLSDGTVRAGCTPRGAEAQPRYSAAFRPAGS